MNRVDSDEYVEDSSDITADALLAFIRANVEQIGGRLVCRASIFEELRRRGVERPRRVRTALVKELERRGLVNRPDPRSRWLIVIETPGARAHLSLIWTGREAGRPDFRPTWNATS